MSRAELSSNWRVKSDVPSIHSRDSITEPAPKLFNEIPRGRWHQYGVGKADNAPEHANQDDDMAIRAMDEGRRLYVGNMPYMATKEDVEELFQEDPYTIKRISISIDPFTHRNPSYCFVELETREQAEEAMRDLNGKNMLGRPVKIKPGISKNRSQKSSRGGAESWNDFRSFRGQAGANSHMGQRWQRADHKAHSPEGNGCRLFVGGLPRMPDHNATETEIRKLFEGFNILRVSKLISPSISQPTENARNGYYLFVDIPTVQEAEEATRELHGVEVPWGGTITVSKARNGGSWKTKERDRYLKTQGDR